jgi:predicted nuclease of restriction endonuclease-like (RecB) superfamily
MKKKELALYRNLIVDIKSRVRQAQHRAALSANAEMILLYWDIGRMIAARQIAEGWGAGVIPRLATDLKNDLPEEKGFSERNIKRMLRFYQEYSADPSKVPQAVAQLDSTDLKQTPVEQGPVVKLPANTSEIGANPALQSENTSIETKMPQPVAQSNTIFMLPIVQRAIAQLPWGHNILLFEKIKHLPTRLWYARQALEQGWSRDALTAQIKNQAHERQGEAITNFASTLPEAHAGIAQGLLKDPYLFDFLTLEEPFHERELETGLLQHLEKFLLELGRGFAFVGRQYRLEVSDREFYLDLLFYHLHLRCFIVVDLKKGDFKPEYAGKMNFYCSAVDDLLKHKDDAPTIGLILCQTKDRILAEYSLKDINKPIGLADYELTRALPKELSSSLPSIEDIEGELAEEVEKGEGK